MLTQLIENINGPSLVERAVELLAFRPVLLLVPEFGMKSLEIFSLVDHEVK